MSTNPHTNRDQTTGSGATDPDARREVYDDRGAYRDSTAGRYRDGSAAGDRDDRLGDDHGTYTVAGPGRREVVAREKDRYGGVKIGSAFFGWLTATGTAVLLTALLAAAGTAVGLATGTTAGEAASEATSDPGTIGLVGAIVLLALLFLAYYCGGYVAGRMARFNGARQGVAVWLWALFIAVLVALLGAVAGSEFNVLADLNSFPRIPVGEGDLSTAGILAVIGVAVASLAGAVLGGIAGMRFHRRVDRAGFDEI